MLKPLGFITAVKASWLTPEERLEQNRIVLDEVDRKQAPQVKALGMRPVVTDTIMRGLRERKALARIVIRELGVRT